MGRLMDREALRGYGAVTLLMIAGHIFCTWPVWLAPTQLMLGWEGDNLLFAWNLAWVAWSTNEVRGPLFNTTALFYPEGFSFLFHTHTWLYGMMFRAADPLLGLIGGPESIHRLTLGYNLLMMVSSIATGLAYAALARFAGCRSWLVTLLVAYLGTFSVGRQFSLYGHLNILGVEFFLWSVFAQLHAERRTPNRFRWWMLAGVLAGLAWLNDQTMGMFALLFFGILRGVQLIRCAGINREAIFGGAGFVSCFLATAAVHLVPLVRVYLSADYYVASAHQLRLNDSLNLLLPSDYNWLPMGLWGLRQDWGIENGTGVGRIPPALIVACMAAVVIWYRIKKSACTDATDGAAAPRTPQPSGWLLLVVAAFGVTCVLGEWLVVAGQRYVPLPYRVFRMLPVLENLRIPDRFVLFALLPAVMVGAWGLDQLRSISQRWFVCTVVLMISLAAVEARLVPVRIETGAAPYRLPSNIIESIRARGGAVWSLPAVSGNPLANAWQAQHLRPELFGLAARVPTALVDGRREEFPFLRWAMDRRDISWESYRQSLEQDDRQVDESLQRFVTTHGLTTILYASGAGAEDQQRLLQITDAERWEALGVRFIAVQKDAPPAEVGN